MLHSGITPYDFTQWSELAPFRTEQCSNHENRFCCNLFLTGLMVAVGAQSLETTSLTACVNDSISLPGNDPSRLVKQSWWKVRYQDSPWIEIGHCVKARGCITSKTVLPDFTRVWIRSNGSLIVERSEKLNGTILIFGRG